MHGNRVRRRSLRSTAVLGAALLLVIGGCTLPLGPSQGGPNEPGDSGGAGAAPIVVGGSAFTLVWNGEPTATGGYRLYVRERGASAWSVLAATIAVSEFTVTENDLPFGSYEFAVSSLGDDGEESSLHFSFDAAARPEPWYLSWNAP